MTYAANAMVATSHPLAANVALDILKSGGNAMDGAIAGAVLLGICEPHMTGIGGDLFALWNRPGTDEIQGLNGSGRSPMAMDGDRLRAELGTRIPQTSAHAVTMPGAVDAFCRLSAEHGKLDLAQLLAPAIHYAREGVPVAPRVANDWACEQEILTGAAREFYLLNGEAPKAGDMFRAPGMALVLEKIAKNGRAGFYEGEVAQDILATLNALGGAHAAEDLGATQSTDTTPISAHYKEAEVFEHPPNGQGATALLMLNILSKFDLTQMDPLGSQRAHLEAEATKLAYGLRNDLLGDADMADMAPMLADETAARLAGMIDPNRAGPATTPISGAPHKDTVCITVVDQDGMSVSLIYSIFAAFGSGIATDKFGLLLHNRGSGFNLISGHPNEAGPGKRPFHTIIPGITRRGGRIEMPFAVMGGQYQSCGHARLITSLEDFGMDIQTAIDAPRCFAEQGRLRIERSYHRKTLQELADLGHDLRLSDTPIGGGQAIRIDHERGVFCGGSDPRKDGCAIGY